MVFLKTQNLLPNLIHGQLTVVMHPSLAYMQGKTVKQSHWDTSIMLESRLP